MFRTFVLMRVAVGGLSYVAPRVGGRLVGLDGQGHAAYWARLFGVRDVVLGVAALTTEGAARRRIVQLTAACDAADVVSAIAGRRGGHLSPVTTGLSAGLAGVAGAVAVAALAELEPQV